MVAMSRISFDWLERREELMPDKTALIDVYTNRSYTYREFNKRANRLANGWRDKWGIQKGDRVGILARNRSEYLEALFAAAKIGAILVPINIRLAGPELSYIINDSEPVGILLAEEYVDPILEIKHNTSKMNYLLLDGSASQDMMPYEDFLKSSDDRVPQLQAPVTLDDPQIILYTSGTTGYPKGSIQTHGNILFNSINAILSLDIISSDIFLCGLPMFHTGGLHVQTTPTLHAGGTIVIMRSFDAGEALKLIHEGKVNTVFFVYTMWQFMCEHEDFHTTDFSGLRMAWSGGGPCPLPVLEAFQDKGVPLSQGYGLTEAGPDATILLAEDSIRKLGSIGKSAFHNSIRIVDDNGIEVSQGEVGEILLRGPTVTPGYWNKPEATAESLKRGWFHTGDLAFMDEEGYYFIVDRKKDMIISGGENIYPAEIEKVIYQHPKVAKVAVVGVPHERWGEVGHAVVCPKTGEKITEEEIINFLLDKLARFKIPKSVSFMDELPQSPSGKILKRVLKEPFWKNKQ
jgi:fatty-acyl-CoA synthase